MPTGTSIRRAGLEDAETVARMVAALSEAEGGPVPHFDALAYRRDGFGAAALRGAAGRDRRPAGRLCPVPPIL
jgi:hypothetical protein